MAAYRIAPAHIDEGCFTKLVAWIRDTRIKAKHSDEDVIDGIPKETLAQALKIVINSIYGKLGFEAGDICDKLAVLKVTINGQLFIMMLCETLEMNGIEVVSANTDGIVVKLTKANYQKFKDITDDWEDYTGLSADSEMYKAYINRDINNYVCQETNGKLTYKGDLNPLMYLNDLSKGYDEPIVAKAVVEYFINGIPIIDTLYAAKNILDFCKTQNIGRKFHTEFIKGATTYKIQRNVRFYVSNFGGNLFKVSLDGNKSNLCSGYYVEILNTLDDIPIEQRNINYQYYYNECLKIIDPIKLSISPNQKAGNGIKSGRVAIQKKSESYDSLFDDNE